MTTSSNPCNLLICLPVERALCAAAAAAAESGAAAAGVADAATPPADPGLAGGSEGRGVTSGPGAVYWCPEGRPGQKEGE